MNKKRNNYFIPVLAVLLLAGLAALGPVQAQARRLAQNSQGTRQRDPLASLKQALNRSGAAALDSSQETALNALITNFLNATKPGTPDGAVQAARDAYGNAILARDLKAATAAADSLADLLSARQRTMLEADANFQVQALTYLHNDQVAALQAKIGNNGILRVLQSLIRPGLGPRPGLMGGRRLA